MNETIWVLPQTLDPSNTIKADFCVVGGGGCGLAAAVQAAELGLSVVILEQRPRLGGAFGGVEGMTGLETKFTQADGGVRYSGAYYADRDYDVENAVSTVLGFHRNLPLYQSYSTFNSSNSAKGYPASNRAATNRLYRTFFGLTSDTIEWLEEHGVSIKGAIAIGDGPKIWHVFESKDGALPGDSFIAGMVAEAVRLGVNILLDTAAKKIVLKDGHVAGVLAQDRSGRGVLVETERVLLCTGGFADDDGMLRSTSVPIRNERVQPVGVPCRRGDGLRMGRDAGASMAEGFQTCMWCGPVTRKIGVSLWMTDAAVAVSQPMLWVNELGERFCKEDLWIDDFYSTGVMVRNQRRTFSLFTERDVLSWEQSGPYGQVFSFGTPGVPLSDVRRLLLGDPDVHVGDDLEALCTEAGLPYGPLRQTVERYNRQCASAAENAGGTLCGDTDFGKNAEFMHPVEEGPYWLVELSAGLFCTLGGMRVNEHAQVLDASNRPIPGLYAGGCDAGGLYGDAYDVRYSPGSQSAWAIVSGRLAAQDAAERVHRATT